MASCNPVGPIVRSPGRVGKAFRDEVRQAVGIAAAGRIDAVRVRNEESIRGVIFEALSSRKIRQQVTGDDDIQ